MAIRRPYLAGRGALDRAHVALQAAQENYQVAHIRYESEKSTLVEVLDALAAKVKEEGNVSQAAYLLGISYDGIRRAVGL